MSYETYESISFPNEIQLHLPQVERMIIHDIEQRIILGGGERQFQNFPDKKRHHRTATAALRLQMSHGRYGHIVGKLVRIVPLEIAVHDSCTEPSSAKLFDVFINFLGSLQECVALVVESAVMAQIMHVDFTSAGPD